MRALTIYAGTDALRRIRERGLNATEVHAVPAAAGGPKGLILTRLDQFIFGEWLNDAPHPIHLIGASIGAWRMATACMADPIAGFKRLENDYIRQRFDSPPGRARLSSTEISARFTKSLQSFYGDHVETVLDNPRYHLHFMTSRGRGLLRRDTPWRTPIGYAGAYLFNSAARRGLGAWLERVVFSTYPTLPFGTQDIKTTACRLTTKNFLPALQASCAIPFVLDAVHDIEGGPRGAYWDGGITDYHLHLDYQVPTDGVVLYPHFQQAVVPGWLDKVLKWRHGYTDALSQMVVLAPNPEWVKTLPNGKLPDRRDFNHYENDFDGRVNVWQRAADESQRLADEWAQWLDSPDPSQVHPL